MSFEHSSGVPDAFDRAQSNGRKNTVGVIHRDGPAYYPQGAELNEMQSIADRRFTQIGGLVAKNGDKVEGCSLAVDVDLGKLIIGAGQLYYDGHVLPIEPAIFEGVDLSGDLEVGFYVTLTTVDEVDDPTLLGLKEGTAGEGEPGAARQEMTIAWGYTGDGQSGVFNGVYRLRDGTIIENNPPPLLSGYRAAISNYDRVTTGNAVAEGMRVRALGRNVDKQVFVIGAGLAHVYGYQIRRDADLRHEVLEEWSSELVEAEIHQFVDQGGGQFTIEVAEPPIDNINQILVTKRVTESVTRGPIANTEDILAENSIYEIESVVVGGTTYVEDTDYQLNSNKVDWSLGGAEPSGGTTYDVTYLYWDVVSPVSQTDTSVTISGGVVGKGVQLQYTSKLPRQDVLGINSVGEPVYIKGTPSRISPKPPVVPEDILPLAYVHNTFADKPRIEADKTHRIAPHELIWRVIYSHLETVDMVALNRLQTDLHKSEPVARNGTFVDPFINDRYRDQNEAQTAAIGFGALQLPIHETVHAIDLTTNVMLDWVEKVHSVQDWKTECMPINPYQNFEPLPASLVIDPPVDLWVEEVTQWASPVTNVFTEPTVRQTDTSLRAGFNDNRVVRSEVESSSNSFDELVAEREERIENLRQIDIDYTIAGFGNGEELTSLSFAGVDITPAGPLVADVNGEISGTFTIPADVPSGQKSVLAIGGSGTEAEALFVGQGTLNIDVMRNVTNVTNRTIEVVAPPGETAAQRRRRRERERRREARRRRDPLAQGFFTNHDRHIVGIDVEFCNIGNPANNVIVELVKMRDGTPTDQTIDQAVVKMSEVTTDVWTQVRFKTPKYLSALDEYAFVFKTDDADHALAVAQLGAFDTDKQDHVTGQPYTFGTLQSGADAVTWLPHPDKDLKMRIIEAEFSSDTKTVDLGSFAMSAATDLLARVVTYLPTEETGIQLELERASGEVIRFDPAQPVSFDEYLNETVQLRAILTGNQYVSPTLGAIGALIEGQIQTTGTYVTRAFEMGTGVNVTARMRALLPSGSSVAVSIDKADDNWQALPADSSDVLGNNWFERKFATTGFTADNGRIKIELTGGPSARPILRDLRAFSANI